MVDFFNLRGIEARNVLPPYLASIPSLPDMVVRRRPYGDNANWDYSGVSSFAVGPGKYKMKVSVDFAGWTAPVAVSMNHNLYVHILRVVSTHGGTSSKSPVPYPRGLWIGSAAQVHETLTNRSLWIASGVYVASVGFQMRMPHVRTSVDNRGMVGLFTADRYHRGGLLAANYTPNLAIQPPICDFYYLLSFDHDLEIELNASGFPLFFD